MNQPISFFQNLTVLWRTFKHYHWQIVVLITLGFVSAALDGIGINAVIPLVSFYTNAASAPTDFISQSIQSFFAFFHIPFTFRYLLGFILALFFLRAIIMTVSGYVRGWISADFLGRESESMLARMLRASWPFLLTQRIGTLQGTLVRDIQRSENLLQVFGQIIQSFSGFFIYLLVAFNISATMTLSALIAAVVLFAVVRPFMRRAQKMADKLARTEKDYTHFLSEHIIGMKTFKAAGIEERAVKSGGALVRTLRSLSIRMAFIRSLSTSLFQPFSLIFVVVLFAIEYRQPDFNMISFAAALYLIQKIFTYLESGQGALHSIRETVPYVQNVEDFKRTLDLAREADALSQAPVLFERVIEFHNVSFAYTSGKKVLSSLSFSIEKGATVGLIGPSGSGKTSVADLLLRLFRPTEGAIRIDDRPIDEYPLESWRRSIGYVSQDVFLLNATIEENIRFYRPELTKDEIIRAAEQANIHDFIVDLPDGFEAITGDKGVMLSGGQRQRIALARALVGKPQLLILDEATSALDHESERLIHESIRALHGMVTVLVIAHRPSTVAEADRIFVLDDGHIVERGTPRELLENADSYFARMQRSR